MAQYTVQAPDGKMITLEGPEGAAQSDVIAQAQKLYNPTADSRAASAPGIPKAPIPPGLTGPKQGEENSVGGAGNEPGLPAIVMQGIHQLGRSVPAFANSFARGASDLMEGVGKTAAPLAIPAAVMAPLTASGAAVGSYLGAKGSGALARAAGVSPDTERMVSDIGALPGAILGGKGTQLAGRAVAEGAMNSAVGAGIRAKGFGARPGYAALSETSGIRPAAMQESAQQRIGDINAPYEARIANAPPVSLDRPRAVMDALAHSTRNPETVTGARPFLDSLYGNRVTGQPYGGTVPAREALDIRRNLGDIVNWRPQEQIPAAQGAGRSAYHELGDVIHEAAPGTKDLATRMHNLIPFAKRAGMADLNAGPVETGISRATRPTGGLLPAMLAGGRFGPIGAIGELAGQEALGQPTVKAAIARALWRGVGGERLEAPAMPLRQLSGTSAQSGPMYNWRNNPMDPRAQGLLEGPGGGETPESNYLRHGEPEYRRATKLLEAPQGGTTGPNVLPRGPAGAEHSIGPASPVVTTSRESPITGGGTRSGPYTSKPQPGVLNRAGRRATAMPPDSDTPSPIYVAADPNSPENRTILQRARLRQQQSRPK